MDLKQQVVTSPVFAPLRRVERPGLALHTDPAHLSLGLADLQLRRAGEMAANISQSLVQVERNTRDLLALNINMRSLDLKNKDLLLDAASVGGPVGNCLEMMRRQEISVRSLHLGGFQLITDFPADQFYQRLLGAGQISPRSE